MRYRQRHEIARFSGIVLQLPNSVNSHSVLRDGVANPTNKGT
jgi:hypothetical protein